MTRIARPYVIAALAWASRPAQTHMIPPRLGGRDIGAASGAAIGAAAGGGPGAALEQLIGGADRIVGGVATTTSIPTGHLYSYRPSDIPFTGSRLWIPG